MRPSREKPERPRAEWVDIVVRPPETMSVDGPANKPVLYMPDGTPLIKRPAGFDTGDKR
jgi:hypothetical protein